MQKQSQQMQVAVRPAVSTGRGAGARPPPVVARAHGRVSQVQVVVGHFCRFAFTALVNVMAGKPNKDAMETELRDMIKDLWTKWVRGFIEKEILLDDLSDFVRKSTPEASDMNVVKKFETWYSQQLELQEAQDSNRG